MEGGTTPAAPTVGALIKQLEDVQAGKAAELALGGIDPKRVQQLDLYAFDENKLLRYRPLQPHYYGPDGRPRDAAGKEIASQPELGANRV